MHNKNLKPFFLIELTITNGCNCHCSYCFEQQHQHISNIDEELRQLNLIKDACENFDSEKYGGISLSFWGGEPMVNFEFLKEILETTYQYNFIFYNLYTNGTLYSKFEKLIALPFFEKIKDRFHIQLSYDGEPHHTLKRGNNKDLIFKTADLLLADGLNIDFKATLAADMFDKLPEIWDSYYDLFLKYGERIIYTPTIDTSYLFNDEKNFEIWKKSLIKLAKKEFLFFKKFGRFLSIFFNPTQEKLICNLNNSVFMHSNGNIYHCHGCPYLLNSKKFILTTTKNIKSLYDIKKENFNLQRPYKCLKCGAIYCAICNILHLKSEDNIYNNWSSCMANNKMKCKYYKYLGYINKILKYLIIKYK